MLTAPDFDFWGASGSGADRLRHWATADRVQALWFRIRVYLALIGLNGPKHDRTKGLAPLPRLAQRRPSAHGRQCQHHQVQLEDIAMLLVLGWLQSWLEWSLLCILMYLNRGLAADTSEPRTRPRAQGAEDAPSMPFLTAPVVEMTSPPTGLQQIPEGLTGRSAKPSLKLRGPGTQRSSSMLKKCY